MSNDKKLDLKLSSLSRFGIRGRGGRGASGAASRLPSLKPSRDLTLGGSGTPKRTFTPNIVGRTTKKEEGDGDSRGASSSRDRGRNRNPRGRGRGRGQGRGARGRGDIIQSTGVFSQGIFARETLAGALSGGSYSRGGGGSTISVKDDVDDTSEGVSKTAYIKNMKGEEEGDSEKIFEVLDDEGKIEVGDDEIKSGGLMPITLPLASKLSHKIKTEPDIKSEVTSQDEDEEMPSPRKSPIKKPIRKTTKDDDDEATIEIKDVFKKEGMEEGQLFFLQLPDALPINYLAQEDEEEVKKEGEPNSTASKSELTDTEEIEEKLKKFSFNNVSEGYLGKLQIRESGKVQMRLGNVTLDLTLGTPCGFLQDLISVNADKSPRDMVCLGHINHRIIAVPDYESLLGSVDR